MYESKTLPWRRRARGWRVWSVGRGKGLALDFGSHVGVVVGAGVARSVEAEVCDVRNLREGDGKTLIRGDSGSAGTNVESGRGRGAFPAGTYLSQPLEVRTKTTLLLEEKAMLRPRTTQRLPAGRRELEDVLAGRSKGPFAPFLSGSKLTDVTLTGKGTIDGSGGAVGAGGGGAQKGLGLHAAPAQSGALHPMQEPESERHYTSELAKVPLGAGRL